MGAFPLDLKHAVRSLFRSPGFTLAAVLTLGFGIGANSAMYSVMDRVLGPLPYKDQDRLAVLLREDSRQVPASVPISAPVYRDYQAGMTQAQSIAAWQSSGARLTQDGEALQISTLRATWTFFQVAGFQAALGRTFVPEEDAEGAPRTVVLDHGFWQRRFGGDPGIVGRTLQMDGRDARVVGVMGPDFDLFRQLAGESFDAYVPMSFTARELELRYSRSFRVFLRLKPGTSLEAATQDARRVHAGLNERDPGNPDRNYLPRVAPIKEMMGAQARPPILALLGIAGFTLLIACANLSSLLLARGMARQRELTICSALGASRRALVERLLAEGLLLGMLGGVCALGVAHLLLGGLGRVFASGNLGTSVNITDFGLGGRVLVFNFLLVAVSMAVFSLLPAWQASRVRAADALKEGAKGSAGPSRLRNTLVVFEVALAVILLVGAGLMQRSLRRLCQVDPGFDTRQLLTVRMSVPRAKYPTPEARMAFVRGLLDRVGATPGIRLAAVSDSPPMQSLDNDVIYTVRGVTPPPDGYTNALFHRVTPGFFRTMGIPLLRGRDLLSLDEQGCVINETMARTHWAGGDPLGQHLVVDSLGGKALPVVGVVADVQQVTLGGGSRTQIYAPTQNAGGHLCLRTEGPPAAVLPALRQALKAHDPEIILAKTKTGEDIVGANLARPSMLGWVFTGFGLLGLLLAALGLYGLMGFVVGQRTREIGIRMALGGQARTIVGEILRRGLGLTLAGLLIGLPLAVALGRFLASQLYRTGALDPLAMAFSAVVLGLVALVATLLPASRAARVDPVVALRDE